MLSSPPFFTILMATLVVNLYYTIGFPHAEAVEYPLPCFDPHRRHKDNKNQTVQTFLEPTFLVAEKVDDSNEHEAVDSALLWKEEDDKDDDGEHHIYPVLWLFETQGEYDESPEILADIEEAFVTSANEAHGVDKVVFERAAIEATKHDLVESEKSQSLVGNGRLRGNMKSDTHLPLAEELQSSGFFGWRRHKKSEHREKPISSDVYRYEYIATTSMRCRLCGGDDLYYFSTNQDANGTAPLQQDEVAQYLTVRAHHRWELMFCRKLHEMKALGKPSRCYIKVDRTREPGSQI